MSATKLPMQPSHLITEMNHPDLFIYQGRHYHPLDYDKGHQRFQSADAQKLELRLSHEEIAQAIHLETAEVRYNYYTKHMSKLRWVVGDRTLDDFGYDQVIMAFRRERFILAKEQLCRGLSGALSREELGKFLEEYNDVNQPRHIEAAGCSLPARGRCNTPKQSYDAPSTRTFYRWEREYLSCGRDVRCLVDRHHGPGKSRVTKICCPESFEIWHEVAREYLSRRKPTKAALLRACKARIHEANIARKQTKQTPLIAPTRKRFEAIINSLDQFAVLAGREGPVYAQSAYKAKMSGFDVDRPGERVEFDGWTVDLQTLLTTAGVWGLLSIKAKEMCRAIRVVLLVAIDVATRYVLGMTATLNANADATIATLEMAMSDKTELAKACGSKMPWFGIRPEAVEADHGSEFKERARAVMVQAMIAMTHPPAGKPFRRPFIETLFRTFGLLILPYFDGRTFSNHLEKGDYDAEANATLAVEEFLMLFIRGICDIYHLTPHSGLNGNTPHNAMVEKRSTYRLRALPNSTEMRNLFGVTITKPVTQSGVTIHGITYNNDTLQNVLRTEGKTKLRVRFHTKNLSAISVQSERGWFRVENTIGLDRSVTFGEWITAHRMTASANADSAAQNLSTMYDAINDIRSSTNAAALRENITPHRLSEDDHARLERSMFEGRPAFVATETPALIAPATPVHPLHHGSIGDRAASVTTINEATAPGFDAPAEMEEYDEFGDF